MDNRRCYTAFECAEMLGMSLDAFYEQRARLHANKGMPASASLGRIRIPKHLFEAWLNGDKTKRPMAAANDAAPGTAPTSIERERAALATEYGGRR